MVTKLGIWCGHRGDGVQLVVGDARIAWCLVCAQMAVAVLQQQLSLKPAETVPGDGAVRIEGA